MIGVLFISEPILVPPLLCLVQGLAPKMCSINVYSRIKITEIHEVYYLTSEYILKSFFYYLELQVDFHFRDFTVLINVFQNKCEAK